MACEDGIYEIDQNYNTYTLLTPIKNLRKAQIDKNGTIIAQSKHEGIWIINNNKAFNYKLPSVANLKINDFSITDSDEIWLATNKGLIKISSKNPNSHVIYDIRHGLPERNFKKIEYMNGDLFVGSEEEIFHLRKDWINALQNQSKLRLNKILTTRREAVK